MSRVLCLLVVASIFAATQSHYPGAVDDFYRYASADYRFPGEIADAFESVYKNATPSLPSLSLKMIDATGKPGSGLLRGNTQFIGDFDECVEDASAQYYLFSANLTFIRNETTKNATKIFRYSIPLFRWGICVNASMNETLLHFTIVSELEKFFLVKSVSLIPYKKQSYTGGAIAVITIFCLIGVLVVLSTLYDVIRITFMREKEKKERPPAATSPTKSVNSLMSGGSSDKSSDLDKTNLLGSVGSLAPARGSSRLMAFFNAFSMARNLSKLLDTSTQAKSIRCLHGIRTISMFWIILGHSYVWYAYIMNLANPLEISKLVGQFAFQGIANAFLAVDTFFFLSGLLVMYLLYQRMEATIGHFPWFNYYFHRFWRLTPTYFAGLVIVWQLLPYFAEGPFWDYMIPKFTNGCNKYWWTNLLYINNFHPSFYDQCMAWTWYLATDMQLYILTPLFLLPAYFYGVKGLLIPSSLAFAGTYITIVSLSTVYKFPANALLSSTTGSNHNDYSNIVYGKFYTRAAPYLVGLIFGYCLARRDQFSKGPFLKLIQEKKRILVPIAWCLAFIFGLAVVYGLYDYNRSHPHSQALSVFYLTFSTTAWAIALSIVVFLCHTGHGGIINIILSWPGWVPLSRLTYSAYLLHPIVLSYITFSARDLVFISHSVVAFRFVATLGLSYLFATLLSLCIEYPCAAIEKLFGKTVKV